MHIIVPNPSRVATWSLCRQNLVNLTVLDMVWPEELFGFYGIWPFSMDHIFQCLEDFPKLFSNLVVVDVELGCFGNRPSGNTDSTVCDSSIDHSSTTSDGMKRVNVSARMSPLSGLTFYDDLSFSVVLDLHRLRR